MLDALIGGPEFALRYAQSLRQRAKDEWVDPAWVDGGAVVDLDRRRLLFFGDEVMVEMRERRAVMRVLAAVWPEYAIGWACDGTAELAGYVGRSCGPARGTSGRGCGSPVTETRCVILFLLSTPRDKFGCGRCGGTSVRPGTGPR